MLTAEARRRLAVVLVGARNPQNIGAAARALQDFGFRDLRVVNEFAPPFEAAQLEANQFEAKSAVGAGEVMRSARLFSSLPEAIADCNLVAGTTAIGERGLRLPIHTLRDAARHLLGHLAPTHTTPSEPRTHLANPSSRSVAPTSISSSRPEAAPTDSSSRPEAETGIPGELVRWGVEGRSGETPVFAPAHLSLAGQASSAPRVALLFGSEKTGLTNDQLSHCSLLLTIPLFAPEGRHLSMNLGQSVAVCLYELTREGFEGARELPVGSQVPATSADRERLTALLLELMHTSGYARRFPANVRLEVVRQLTGTLGQTRAEAATWMGLLKQLQRPDPNADLPPADNP